MAKKPSPILNPNSFAAFMEREMDTMLAMKYRHWDLWRHFIAWLLAELQEDTEEAQTVIDRMPDAVDAWARWRTALVECVRASPLEDALGMAYMRIGAGSREMGQYFTPQPIADLIASISIGDEIKDLPAGRLARGCEPACGSGTMILSAERHRRAVGLPPIIWHAMDLDQDCAKMCAIQMCLNDIPAIVLCGNSLTWGFRTESATVRLISPRVRVEVGGKIAPLREVTERQTGIIMDNLERHAVEVLRLQEVAREWATTQEQAG